MKIAEDVNPDLAPLEEGSDEDSGEIASSVVAESDDFSDSDDDLASFKL